MEIHIYTRKSNKNRKISIIICDFFFFFAYTEQKEIEANQKKLYVFHI